MTYRTLLIDDEPLAIQRLTRLLAPHLDKISILDTATNGNDALEKIDLLKPDLIFLDIQMPGLTGFDVVEQIRHQPHIIFCTAFDEYALKAFDTHAIDYLLKPVAPERLARAIGKIDSLSKKKEAVNQKLSDLIQHLKKPRTKQIQARLGDRIKFINIEDIYFFHAKDKYVEVCTYDGTYLISQTLNQLDAELQGTDFVRIHRSALINMKYVDEVIRWFSGGYKVKMKDKEQSELPVSRGEKHKLGL